MISANGKQKNTPQRQRPAKLSLIGSRKHSRKISSSGIRLAIYIFLVVCSFISFYQIGYSLGLLLQEYEVVDEEQDRIKWSKVPSDWDTFSRDDVRRHYKCLARDADQKKPLPSLQDFELMRRMYQDTVDPTAKFDDPVPPTVGYTLDEHGPQPYYPKYSEGMGRGLFATRDIKKGELVHNGTRSDVVFPNATAWRRYIFSLPRDFACDTTSWNWTQQRKDGKMELRSSINIAILMNSGGRFNSNTRPKSATSYEFVATRDIAKDDEILYNYNAYTTDWAAVGL